MKVLDLFSGIGGFSLGLERAGFKTSAFCEIDQNAIKVLKKHWPDVPVFEDVTKLRAKDIPCKIDLICGGFPCQDISVAGKGEGLSGKRSGLWKEFYRIIEEAKPRFVIVENVANLRSKGLGQVLKDLWKIGFDCQWHCIPASAVGAPHRRDRIWIIAYSDKNRLKSIIPGSAKNKRKGLLLKESYQDAAYTFSERLQRHISDEISILRSEEPKITEFGNRIVPSFGQFRDWYGKSLRISNGVSERLDKNRLSLCGNAVVPQIPELIGKAIKQAVNNEVENE